MYMHVGGVALMYVHVGGVVLTSYPRCGRRQLTLGYTASGTRWATSARKLAN